jgi:hypothetical protein
MAKTIDTEKSTSALGALTGRVQPSPSSDPSRFTLYEERDGAAVPCLLKPGHEDVLRDAWGRRAIVEGRVSRDGETGRAVSVTDVDRISLLEDVEPGSLLRAARGIAPAPSGAEPPEIAIRRLRDE